MGNEAPAAVAGPSALIAGNRFTSWAVASLGVWAFMGLLVIDSLDPDIRHWNDRKQGIPVGVELARSHVRLVEITIVMLVVTVASALCFLLWEVKAHTDARAMRPGEVRFGPVRVLAGWLVPIASLIVPFAAMRELWKASHPDAEPGRWRAGRTNPLVPLWWLLWLGALALAGWGVYQNFHMGGVVLVFHRPGGDPARFLARDWTFVAATALGVLDALVALVMIVWINDRQFQRVRRVGGPLWAARRAG